MARQISADGYVFDFKEDILDAILFDSPKYNGAKNMMKSVDIIAEFPNEYLFIELKKYDPSQGGMTLRCPLWDDKKFINEGCPLNSDERKRVQASIKKIAHDLRSKYCDSFLYYFAEGKLTKDVNYICVVEGCDSAQTLRLKEIMLQIMPKGIPPHTQWQRPIVKNVAVVNEALWNATDELSRYGRCSLEE